MRGRCELLLFGPQRRFLCLQVGELRGYRRALLGRLLEAKAKAGTGEAVRALLGLQARTARVVHDDAETEIPVQDVIVDDEVVIRPGEKVPADAEVRSGASAVDESMVTGEAMLPLLRDLGVVADWKTITAGGGFLPPPHHRPVHLCRRHRQPRSRHRIPRP
ncbi:hypothetical protein ACFWJW_13180 [Streptomyces sp. NPDC127097]|uniref:P-type ATPase n=1 Tax=Streptomyces sp. NPDC127097 TaxID=3347136 RepID=UPI003655BE97